MKALLVSHTCVLQRAGQERAAHLACRDDIELTVLTPEWWNNYGRRQFAEPPLNDRYRLVTGKTRCAWPTGIAPGKAMSWQWYTHWHTRELKKLLREWQPDILDLWEEPWNAVSAQAVWLRNRFSPQTRIVVETEQNIYKDLPPPFRWFQAYVIRHADYAVARSGEALKVLRRKGYRGPGAVIGNGVDNRLFRPMERAACRKAAGLEKFGFVVGYAGRIVPEKGLDTVIRALAALPETFAFCVVGGGSAQEEWMRLADSLGVGERVLWKPAVSLDKLPEWMNALDAFVLPSLTTARWKEQFGRVLAEAMACGVPVVGSNSGAIPEVIEKTGEVFEEGNAEQLAACLRRMEADRERRAYLAEAGPRRVEQNYAWEAISRQYARVFAETRKTSPMPETLLAGESA